MGVHVHVVAEAKFCFVSAGSLAKIQELVRPTWDAL